MPFVFTLFGVHKEEKNNIKNIIWEMYRTQYITKPKNRVSVKGYK